MMLSRLRVIWVVFRLHLKQIAVDTLILFGVIVQPFIIALLAIYLLRDTPGFQAIYVIVGSAMTGLWSGTLFFCARNIESERWAGSLESIIGSRTHLATVVLGKTLANTMLSLSSMLFSYPLAILLFGYQVTIAYPWLFIVSLLLTVLAFISLGMVMAPIISLSPGAYLWTDAIEYPIYVLGGFFFSVSLLPSWTRPISYILPPYWAARALHASSSGNATPSDIFVSWGLLFGSSLVCWFISAWLFRIFLRKAREEATLALQ